LNPCKNPIIFYFFCKYPIELTLKKLLDEFLVNVGTNSNILYVRELDILIL